MKRLYRLYHFYGSLRKERLQNDDALPAEASDRLAKDTKSQFVRLGGAIVIVALMIAVIPASSFFTNRGGNPADASLNGNSVFGTLSDVTSDTSYDAVADGEAMVARTDWQANVSDLLDALEEKAQSAGTVPTTFIEEAGFPMDAYAPRANEEATVIGCAVQGTEAEVFDKVKAFLQAKGWLGVDLQGVTGATFIKQTGTLHWLLVTCTQIGEEVALVYRTT